ncbi:hypothetical protein CAPTEDRAFT_187286 [Capitella teleta]|uniref:G-protein coupled receptors family 1 profile domain-containing protein n=1 Tax=Capitella teleta TaxID=283909 RepID=X1ZK40_CAPTE|nr:hypothetical protein CAPTEDRAFT_187286 [Capitella teleta]|eukprot:ELU10121.1 hypothetical protein CAPTEDRAFT_187286 [Capitella teleta]
MKESDIALKSKGCLLPCGESSKISYATCSILDQWDTYRIRDFLRESLAVNFEKVLNEADWTLRVYQLVSYCRGIIIYVFRLQKVYRLKANTGFITLQALINVAGITITGYKREAHPWCCDRCPFFRSILTSITQRNMTHNSSQYSSTESGLDLQHEVDLPDFDSCILYYFIFGTCIGGVLVIVGLAGNAVTIAVMGRERNTSATVNCLFMLAITDTLVLLSNGIAIIPLGLRKLVFGWWNGHNYNNVALLYGIEISRIFNQISAFITMLVTFQRYVSVCYPNRAKQVCSVRLSNIVVAISYLASVLFFLPNFFLYVLVKDSSNRYRGKTLPLALNKTFQVLYSGAATAIVTYIIPVSTLIFMSIQILRAMHAKSQAAQLSREQARKDLTLSSVAIVALFVVCQSFSSANRVLMWVYDPYFVAARCGGDLQYFFFVPQVAMVTNSAANFAIYVVLAKGFRKKVKRLFSRQSRVAHDDSNGRIGDTVGPSGPP